MPGFNLFQVEIVRGRVECRKNDVIWLRSFHMVQVRDHAFFLHTSHRLIISNLGLKEEEKAQNFKKMLLVFLNDTYIFLNQ